MFCLTDICYPDIMNLVKLDDLVVRLKKCVVLLIFLFKHYHKPACDIHGVV